ncbi:helix-turn-helix transcriptional regulator [uncultured Fluviicola sp.]|uniref:helix-turn-helix domain-containing protein n=1 Tax=uncultured Fluviicola sp. TaxID=463303 RepID=UPI0025ED306D|nr:helix-turn-helix transcriptional regulator [uncultured Fluviicola sp.]
MVFTKPPLLYVQNVVDKNFLNALGNRVRELRLARNMTQEDLGFLVGNSGKQIGRIERGENNVSTCMIYQISKALEIPLNELFHFPIE